MQILNDVNLAACLTDGEKIYIHDKKKKQKKVAKETNGSSDEASDGRVNIKYRNKR